jgi:hypothetical protein
MYCTDLHQGSLRWYRSSASVCGLLWMVEFVLKKQKTELNLVQTGHGIKLKKVSPLTTLFYFEMSRRTAHRHAAWKMVSTK